MAQSKHRDIFETLKADILGGKTERLAVRFTPQKDSAVDLDDVYVSPME